MKALPIIVSLALLPAAAPAQDLADPMRPPAAAPVAQRPGKGADTRAGLQTVLISATRRIAVIDGQQVEIGSRIRGGEVAAINPNQVVIRRPRGEQVLELVPGASRGLWASPRSSATVRRSDVNLSVFGARKDLRISRLRASRIQQAHAGLSDKEKP